MCAKKVRRNQWVDGVVFNNCSVLIRENHPKSMMEEREECKTAVFVCTGENLKIGEIHDGNAIGRFIVDHDPGMRWVKAEKFFPDCKVFSCYKKMEANESDASAAIAKYIVENKIRGNILLIGCKSGGFVMYKVAEILENKIESNITLVSVFADDVFKSELRDVAHVSVISASRYIDNELNKYIVMKGNDAPDPRTYSVTMMEDDSKAALKKTMYMVGKCIKNEQLFSGIDEVRKIDFLSKL